MCLRYRMQNFLEVETGQPMLFAFQRIHDYRSMQELVSDNQRSEIRAQGLGCVFYSRFYTLRGLIETDSYLHLLQPEQARSIRVAYSPTWRFFDYRFNQTADAYIALFNREPREHDVFKMCLLEHYECDEELVDAMLALENACWNHIHQTRDMGLIGDFNRLNKNTLGHAQKALRRDMLNCTENKERLRNFVGNNALFLAVLVYLFCRIK